MNIRIEQADSRGGKLARTAAANNGWTIEGKMIHKSGYQIYRFAGGCELAIRDPESTDDMRVITAIEHLDPVSPHYTAAMLYLLRNAEKIVAEAQE